MDLITYEDIEELMSISNEESASISETRKWFRAHGVDPEAVSKLGAVFVKHFEEYSRRMAIMGAISGGIEIGMRIQMLREVNKTA